MTKLALLYFQPEIKLMEIQIKFQMPLTDEENISIILKLNDYFQDLTEELINLVINEIINITIPKEAKIYDINDISNYYYIINKGTINLINNKETIIKKKNQI